jgi:hypothetical protein
MALPYVVEVKDNVSASFKKMEPHINVLNQRFTQINSTTNMLSQRFTQLNKTTNIFNESLGKIGTAMASAGGILIANGISILKDFGKEMIDSYDSAAKLSQNIGITAESVMGLRHAAELSAVGADAMDKNMEKLSKTMFDAASGNKSASESFKQLGISVTNSDGSLKKSDAVLMELADKFKALPPGSERAAAAMNIFGESGASMVSMLKDGSAGLKAMVDEGAGAAGNVKGISEAMEKLNDAGTKTKAALMGMLAGIVDSAPFKAMVSGIESVSDALIKWRVENQKEAEAEKAANLARMEYLQSLQAEINYKREAGKNDDENLIKIGNQFAALQQKVKLTDDEINLMRLLAERQELYNLAAGDTANLWKDEEEALDILEEKIAALEKKKADAAKTVSILPKDDSAAKAYAAETKRLQDWLKNYQDSKRTEQQIAKDNYIEQNKNLEDLAKRNKAVAASLAEYKKQVATDYTDKLKEIDDKANEERIKAAEATQSKELELRRIMAKDYGDIAELEIQQIRIKYEKERKLAEGSKENLTLIKQAEQAEIEAVHEKSKESERQHEDMMRSYRETAAGSDAERIAIQKEGIEAKYNAELEKAQYTADEIKLIEAAKNAELERMDKQLAQVRQELAMQYIDSTFQVANAVAVFSKNGGEAQKAIAMSQAMINTAVAATKAATAAPFPLNIPLVAGAVAQGAVQMKTISAQKFASGGMIPGTNTLIMANEQGREAILNPMAVRAIGGEAGVNALNRGTSNTYNNRSSTTNISISTSVLTQKAFRDEIEPILKRAERRR